MNVREDLLRVHHIEPLSRANGPGMRTVIWFQGCSLGCPGCFNPQTHPFEGGRLWTAERLFRKVKRYSTLSEGLTLSGGEPLQQGEALVSFLARVRRQTSWSVIMLTGYAWEEIGALPWGSAVLGYVDVVIAGRYQARQRLARGLVGSANKTLHFLTSRYTLADLMQVPEAEVIITPEGQVRVTGVDPVHRVGLQR
ncbi:4Fe-4S single cluster domain-containing protein [uncultured Thermanaerothrix sp.]|uniref:4Fe-4S single cluster domain-containing protein n=1 Tax=uncultured Thermanaerothrix sp. TaxID=1195149 RepID=UPI00261D23DE|nr:4Fe-4S single cluster domain-containing protein [uncultured Thermanaerothrix sp.]